MSIANDFLVDVRDPGSASEVAPRSTLPRFDSRFDAVTGAITSTVKRILGQLDTELADGEQPDRGVWTVDALQVSFRLDLGAEAGVVLARDTDRHAVSVTCTYKRRQS